jgi:Tfp pilus assembly protein PilF
MAKSSKKKRGKGGDAGTPPVPPGKAMAPSAVPGFPHRRALHLILLVLVGLAAYSNTFNVPFQFDDLEQIQNNPVITSLDNFFTNSKGYEFNSRRFIGYLTFAVDYHFWGYRVAGYHISNLIIHLLNAMLVYYLVMLSFQTPAVQSGRPRGPGEDAEKMRTESVALFSALLFVSHPVQTGAVTYIVQRLTSLATMFYLLSVILYIKGRLITERTMGGREGDKGKPQPVRLSRGHNAFLWYGLSVVAAVLAMKTKEIAFTLPFVLVLYEFLFFKSGIKRKIIFLLPALLTITIIPISIIGIHKPLGEILSDLSEKTRVQTYISRWDYLMTQLRVVTTYVRLLFFPVGQNLDYDYPIYHSFLDPPVFLSFLFLVSLFGVAVYLLHRSRRGVKGKRDPWHGAASREEGGGSHSATSNPGPIAPDLSPYYLLISFGIFWFFITLSVESSLIPIADVIFEHRVYLPSAGAFIAITAAAFLIADKLGAKWRKLNDVMAAAFVIIILALAAATFSRNMVWHDRLSLWQDVVDKSPNKGRGYNDLGNAYNRAGMLDKAEAAYRKGLSLSPDNYDAHNDLGIVYAKQKRIDDAIEQFNKALALNPGYARPHSNLGIIYAGMNRTKEAIDEFSKAISLNPNNSATYENRGIAYVRIGEVGKAKEDFQRACGMGNQRACENLDKLR